jgi:hypothetical protein
MNAAAASREYFQTKGGLGFLQPFAYGWLGHVEVLGCSDQTAVLGYGEDDAQLTYGQARH